MIYTLTLNPCLDYMIDVDQLVVNEMNRAHSATTHCGGKGINVAIVLARLGFPVTSIGFLGGRTGLTILSELHKEDVKADFVAISEENRTNIKVRDAEGKTTEINSKGPLIDNHELFEIYRKLDQLQDDDYLIISGSIPEGVPNTIYRDLMNYLSFKNIKIVVDAGGDLLRHALEAKPFLVKPNKEELLSYFGINYDSHQQLSNDDLEECIFELLDSGAERVILSLGKEGAIYVDQTRKPVRIAAPFVKVVSTVGAGDSLVAGFIAGFIETNDIEYSLKLGVAAGTATSATTWLATANDIEHVLTLVD